MKALLETLIINLIENSIRASVPCSAITLSAAEQDEGVVIEMSNEGGFGLGLSICKSVTELHGTTMEGSVMQDEAIAIARKAVGGKYGANLDECASMSVLASPKEESPVLVYLLCTQGHRSQRNSRLRRLHQLRDGRCDVG